MKKQVCSLSVLLVLCSSLTLAAPAAKPPVKKQPVDSTQLVRPTPFAKDAFSGYDKSGEVASLKSQVAQVEKEQSDINKKANPIADQLKSVNAEIDQQNAAIRDLEARYPSPTLPPDELAAYNAEAGPLNAWGERLNTQKAGLVDTLRPLSSQWDALEHRRLKLKARLDELERFARESNICKKMSSSMLARQCLNELWDGVQTK
jgi:chromosome segregation ATPase